MSHSRIFQTSDHPIDEDDLIDVSKYYDITSISCDYVDTSDASSDLEWLKQCYPECLDVDVENKTLTVKNARAYKTERLRRIAKQAMELHDLAKEAADNIEAGKKDAYDGSYRPNQEQPSIDQIAYRLQTALSDEGGFWVDDDYYGIMPMNEWLANLSDGDVRHVGNTFDYHY